MIWSEMVEVKDFEVWFEYSYNDYSDAVVMVYTPHVVLWILDDDIATILTSLAIDIVLSSRDCGCNWVTEPSFARQCWW